MIKLRFITFVTIPLSSPSCLYFDLHFMHISQFNASRNVGAGFSCISLRTCRKDINVSVYVAQDFGACA